jgi:hypothetical protein
MIKEALDEAIRQGDLIATSPEGKVRMKGSMLRSGGVLAASKQRLDCPLP